MDDFTREHLAAWIGRTVWAEDQKMFSDWMDRQSDDDLACWMDNGWPSAYRAFEAAAGIR